MSDQILTEEVCKKLGGIFSRKDGEWYHNSCILTLPTKKEIEFREVLKKVTRGKGELYQYHDGVDIRIEGGCGGEIGLSTGIPSKVSIVEEKNVISFEIRKDKLTMSKIHPEASVYCDPGPGFADIKLEENKDKSKD